MKREVKSRFVYSTILMKIRKYTKLKGNKYSVLFDGGSVKLYDDVIVQFELLRRDEIDGELFKEIVAYNNSLDAYYRSLKYIVRKMRTEKEIRDYLQDDYTKRVVDETVKRLCDEGYLNEEVYLDCYVKDAICLSDKGPNKIKSELVKIGYEEEVVRDKIDEVDSDVWFSKIDSLIKKFIKGNRNYGNNKLKAKILYVLGNKGYYKWMIEEVLATSKFDDNAELIDREYGKILAKLERKYAGYELEKRLIGKLVERGFSYDEARNIVDQKKKD